MSQKAIEIILMRQLASYLAMPIFLVDTAGSLVYYNEPAEALLGRRYDETGEMPLKEWAKTFTVTDEDGTPIPPDSLPLAIALQKRQAVHRAFSIRALDGVPRKIQATAFPLEGQGGTHLGAVAIVWEERRP